MVPIWFSAAFAVCVLGMLALDLGMFNRREHAPSMREAAAWSAVWVTLAALFGVGVAFVLGRGPALEYAAGYLIEQALSVDNLFVFLLTFSFFRVPSELQHRVLFWGIIGALVMRGVMIGAGAALLHRFSWIEYLFGAFLVFTAVRLALSGEDPQLHPETNPVLRLVRRVVPVANEYRGKHFFVHETPVGAAAARWVATPLFVVLVFVETTDLVFAVDSIPAVFGVTNNAFIVYTSNVFAILGLRSLFFLLAGMMRHFHYLRYGLAAVLAFVGAKMLLRAKYEVPVAASLGVIAGILATAIGASLLFPAPDEDDAATPPRA